MVGFIKGLLGSKQKAEEVVVQKPEPTPAAAAKQEATAFYLDADEAQSLGNLDYMRTAKAVRRTFPKTVNNAEIEMVQKVSAMMKQAEGSSASIVQQAEGEAQTGETSAPTVDLVAERRRTDTSMDMFRSMAKGMKK